MREASGSSKALGWHRNVVMPGKGIFTARFGHLKLTPQKDSAAS